MASSSGTRLQAGSSVFKRIATNYLVRWDLVQLRCSNFMGCTLVERLALALLELAENFAVDNPRGLLLTASTRHKDLAELVGVSRRRVTEFLIEFERKRMIVRLGRQLIIKRDLLSFWPRFGVCRNREKSGLNESRGGFRADADMAVKRKPSIAVRICACSEPGGSV